jgi:hypothetical protein
VTDLDKRLTEAREIARLKRELDSRLFLQPDEHIGKDSEVIAREAEIARLEAAEKDGEIARIRTALEYKNATIERMQSEHDDALEAKDAEISRLKDELSRWKHVC